VAGVADTIVAGGCGAELDDGVDELVTGIVENSASLRAMTIVQIAFSA